MSDAQTPEPRSGLPWVRIVLFTSLALNLLVVGAFVGSRLSQDDPSREVRSERNQIGANIGPYGRALSKEDRRALGRAFVARAGEFRENRQQMRALGSQVVEALRAEPYDRDLVADLLTRQIAISQQVQTRAQNLLLDRIDEMTPETRAAFADNLEEMLRRGKKRGPLRDN